MQPKEVEVSKTGHIEEIKAAREFIAKYPFAKQSKDAQVKQLYRRAEGMVRRSDANIRRVLSLGVVPIALEILKERGSDKSEEISMDYFRHWRSATTPSGLVIEKESDENRNERNIKEPYVLRIKAPTYSRSPDDAVVLFVKIPIQLATDSKSKPGGNPRNMEFEYVSFDECSWDTVLAVDYRTMLMQAFGKLRS